MLNDKVALITGASRGIGKAIALKMAAQGANIAVIYSGNEQAAEETAKEIRTMGRQAESYRCDVSDFDEAAATVKAVLKQFGTIDILVNNAGITRDNLILMMKEQEFDEVIDINLKGTFNMIRHVSGIMLRKKSGRIVNITSVSGMMGNAGQANYAAAKAGMIGLTKTTAKELASRGITCNAIAPGFVETDMAKKLGEDVLENARKAIPLARLGRPEDIADTAVFLASDSAAYITGEVIKVDGGLYI
ncbi:MAG: 3-oxoacyl-[Firmicutes bacterium]|nr:3-oxoacyl-[acyl-carrier-protein] reductase [Bacillota bacterium]MBQ6685346.1 3-oxoacyl-[acyl-carrier-protein] reductase [Bacillota bacterium]